MFRTKIRKTIITLIAACSLAGLSAVPASAQPREVCSVTAGALTCHQAKKCAIFFANGAVGWWDDGESYTTGGKTYKCNDGSWELARQGGSPSTEPPKNAPEPSSGSSSPPPVHHP